MSSLVVLHVTNCGERLATDLAVVGPFSGVGSEVDHEVTFLSELSHAEFALIPIHFFITIIVMIHRYKRV